jgi:hypothetical protein
VVLVAVVLVVGCGGAGGFGGGSGGNVMAAAVVATTAEVRRWWATTYGRWDRVVGFGFFYCFSKVFAESYFCSRYTCAEWDPLGSRHRALCRPSGAEWAMLRGNSRHRLCREYSGLCREELALGTAPDLGSVKQEWRE